MVLDIRNAKINKLAKEVKNSLEDKKGIKVLKLEVEVEGLIIDIADLVNRDENEEDSAE